MCLVTIFTKRVSDSKAGQAEAQHCNQSQNIHMAQPSFPRFPYGFLCNRRVTVPPERANRLPSWQTQRNTNILRQGFQLNSLFVEYVRKEKAPYPSHNLIDPTGPLALCLQKQSPGNFFETSVIFILSRKRNPPFPHSYPHMTDMSCTGFSDVKSAKIKCHFYKIRPLKTDV